MNSVIIAGRHICLIRFIVIFIVEFISLKISDLTGFYIIKPRHPGGLGTKLDLEEKNSNGSPD